MSSWGGTLKHLATVQEYRLLSDQTLTPISIGEPSNFDFLTGWECFLPSSAMHNIYIYISISIYIHTPACIKKTWGGLLLCFLAQSLFFLLLGFCFVGLLLLFLFLLLLLPVSRIHCFSTDTSSSSWWSQHDRSMPHAAFRTCLCPQIALEFCIA